MTFAISKDTDRDDIEAGIGATVTRDSVRTSDARESRLAKNIRRQARDWGTTVEVDESHPTAHVEAEPGEAPHVVVTGREIPQPTTDYDGRGWDWMAQRAFGVHEVGHIRYTDFEDTQQRIKALPSGDRGTAHSLDNAFEDGAIEAQLTKRWPNYYGILRALRANIFADQTPGIEDPELGGYVFPVAHAMHSAVLDLWTRDVYELDIGLLSGLLDPADDEYHFASEGDRQLFIDEALPIITDAIPKVLSTPDAVKRNEVKFEAIEALLDLLDDAESDGRTQQNGRDGEGDDGSGMPDDSRDNHSGGADATADELGDIDPDDVAESMSGGDADTGEEMSPADLDLDPDDLQDLADDITDADLDAEVAEQANDDAREEAGMTGEMLSELDEMSDVMADAGSHAHVPESLQMPTQSGGHSEKRYQQAKTASNRLAQILRQRLQSERRSEVQRGKRRGRFTGRGGAMVRARQGEKEIKEQKTEPDEKDYNCVIALDRSGSMGGSKMDGAEVAAGMLLLALEDVGVETMLVDLYSNEARLAKPFRTATDARKDVVFSGDATGGTPMAQTLTICRERLNREGGNTFMFVITDGRPSDAETFEAELGKCTFPVVGINLVNSMSKDPAGEGFYHREVKTTPDADLQQSLEALLNEVMF